MRIDWHKHITVDVDIHHGEPCINGTRVPVSMIVGKESIQATLAYAADIVRHDVFLPLAG